RIRGFDRDRPRPAVRLDANGAHLAVDADEGRGDAEFAKGIGQAVDAMAFGDAIQIERERTVCADAISVELEQLVCRSAHRLHGGANVLGYWRRGAEAPSGHGIADADIEGSARGASNVEPEAQD